MSSQKEKKRAELQRTSTIRVEGKEKSEKGTEKCMELQRSHPLVCGEKKNEEHFEKKKGVAGHSTLDMNTILMPFGKRF